MPNTHVQTLSGHIRDAELHGLRHEALGLSGYSGKRLIGTLQRIAGMQHAIGEGGYVEIGVFQGLTLLSVAAADPGCPTYGIDNFSQFDREHRNRGLVSERIQANELSNVTLIDMDYEDALMSLDAHTGGMPVGTYFVDGPHDYRSQLACLNLAKRHLSPRAVIVVDDSNYRHVRLANRDFLLANPEYKLLFEAYTPCHPGNLTPDKQAIARDGWWNGVNILVRDPDNTLLPTLPPTLRDRRMYENEHTVHTLKHGHAAPEALGFLSGLADLRPVDAVMELGRFWLKLRRTESKFVGRYPAMNTYSDGLPGGLFNPALAATAEPGSAASPGQADGRYRPQG